MELVITVSPAATKSSQVYLYHTLEARRQKTAKDHALISLARIFDCGGSKTKITCKDVIRNFQKKGLFMGQRYTRMENQKPGLVWQVTKILLNEEGLEP